MPSQRPDSCKGCPLHDENLCHGFAEPFGRGSLGVLVIAEALGEHEARDSRPLVPKAAAGSVFARALKRMQIDEQQLVIMNAVNCRPPGNRLENEWYEQGAINHCRQYIDQAVKRFRPRAILALGNVSFRAATGQVGPGRGISSLRGYILPSLYYKSETGDPLPVVGSYHPSFIARGEGENLGVLMHDIGKAVRVARGELVEGVDYIYDPFNYQGERFSYNTAPTAHDIREFLAWIERYPEVVIAYDIETNHTKKGKGEDEYEIEAGDQITQIQFSIARGTGIALSWSRDTADLSRRILTLPNPKAAHNGWRFDNPILKRAGMEVRGTNYDTMTMFHHLQPDLPADLQFVGSLCDFPFPWKHYAGSDLAFYGIADVDAVQRIFAKLPGDMKKRGVWDSYMEMVVGLQPVLEGMQARGIMLDPIAREEFRIEVEVEKGKVMEGLQATVPEKLKPRQVYKEWPNEAREFVNRIAEANVIIGPKGGRTLPVVKFSEAGVSAKHHIGLSLDQQNELLESLGPRWGFVNGSLVRVDDFLPNSPLQLKNLILHYGEKVPLNLDYDETTEAPELVKLIERLLADAEKLEKRRKDPEAALAAAHKKRALAGRLDEVITYRKLNKIYGTYIQGWAPGEDGAVHTTYTFRSATWQLTSVDPNVQNGPAHGDLAKKFMRVQVARPGRRLLAFDYGGCHMKTMAFEMGSREYYRMACIDGHSTMAGIMLKLIEPERIFGFSDEEWREWVAWFRSDEKREWVRNKQMKPSLLGIQLGLGANKLYEMNRKSIGSKREAEGMIGLIKGVFPSIPRWQQEIKELAHRQGYLRSRYGGIRWFWNVYRWDARSGGMISGEDAERAIAFPVQNDAFGKKRESMLDLAAEGLDERYGLNNDIHDANYFDCLEEYVEEAIYKVKEIMERPARRLTSELWPEGLVIQTDVKVGYNLAEMEKIKL